MQTQKEAVISHPEPSHHHVWDFLIPYNPWHLLFSSTVAVNVILVCLFITPAVPDRQYSRNNTTYQRLKRGAWPAVHRLAIFLPVVVSLLAKQASCFQHHHHSENKVTSRFKAYSRVIVASSTLLLSRHHGRGILQRRWRLGRHGGGSHGEMTTCCCAECTVSLAS